MMLSETLVNTKINDARHNIRLLKSFLKDNPKKLTLKDWLMQSGNKLRLTRNEYSPEEIKLLNKALSCDLSHVNHYKLMEGCVDIFEDKAYDLLDDSYSPVTWSQFTGLMNDADDWNYNYPGDDEGFGFSNLKGKERRQARRAGRRAKRAAKKEAKEDHSYAFDWIGGQDVDDNGKYYAGLHIPGGNNDTTNDGEVIEIRGNSVLNGKHKIKAHGSDDGEYDDKSMIVLDVLITDAMKKSGGGTIFQEGKSSKEARQLGRAAKKETKGELLDKQRLKDKAKLITAKAVGDKEGLKKAKEVRRARIKEKSKSMGKFIAKIMPAFATARAILLGLIALNVGRSAEKLYPAFITEEQAKKDKIKLSYLPKAKAGWEKAKKRFEALGGSSDRLKKTIEAGHRKRPKGVPSKYKEKGSGVDGEEFAIEYSTVWQAAEVTAVVSGALGAVMSVIAGLMKGGDKEQYESGSPPPYDDTPPPADTNPDINEPGIAPNGVIYDKQTYRLIDPVTGMTRDIVVDPESGEVIEDNETIIGLPKPLFWGGTALLTVMIIGGTIYALK